MADCHGVEDKERNAMANVIEITDFSAPELDVYARLTEAQLLNRFEPAKGMFIAENGSQSTEKSLTF